MSGAHSQGKDRQPNLKARLYKATVSYGTNKYNSDRSPEGNWGNCPVTDESLLFIKVTRCLREEKKKKQKKYFYLYK